MLGFNSAIEKLNIAQKLFRNTVIFTIDKIVKICGAALDYITFLKGVVFFHELGLKAGSHAAGCSQQTFSKARSGISHTVFKECFERVLDFLCTTDSHSFHARLQSLWGLQVIAIASVAFDVLNERILDAQLEPISVDERTLAVRHMENIKSRARTYLLYTMFVFDRGYVLQKKLISYIEDTVHARYLLRLRSKFNNSIGYFSLGREMFRHLYFLRWSFMPISA